jgi:cellulose synthase/poly-beta-1,6-N-acetylglucosamine synthase-like glycosyltransferase
LANSPPDDPNFVSVVVTVKNEERHLGGLLESLAVQEPPLEVVLVDALSRDSTYPIASAFADAHPSLLRVYRRYGSRGIGRNYGVHRARGASVAFIDGDCRADPSWLHGLRDGLRSAEVVAGMTTTVGNVAYGNLGRVELFQSGNDVTFPSCNLAYRRALFDELGGFDPRFITAEDIDLNLRAVLRGARIAYRPDALVLHQARESLPRFLTQAFWNGYGRKQLTEKHGQLWANYRYRRLLMGQRSPVAWARLSAAVTGYLTRIAVGGGHRLTATQPAPHFDDGNDSPDGARPSA